MTGGAFGDRLRLRLFGSSHGPEVGCEIRGLPPGRPIDTDAIQRALDRRRPGVRSLASRRQEPDRLCVDRGLRAGRTTRGTFRAHVANLDARPADYAAIRDTPRPGHADFPARARFGPRVDLAGGGRFSGRMTVGLVIAGAIAGQLLAPIGVSAVAYCQSIGSVESDAPEDLPLAALRERVLDNEVGSWDPIAANRMAHEIATARREGDSVGGTIEARATGVPVGLGEPFFDSIESVLAHLLLSIPGVKGVEFGAGFSAARLRGSENNDPFAWENGRVVTTRNRAGGVLGGLATGMPIIVRVAVKPTPSIPRPQTSVDLVRRRAATIRVPGRHDPCIVPRAVVVVESAVQFALADLALEGGFLR